MIQFVYFFDVVSKVTVIVVTNNARTKILYCDLCAVVMGTSGSGVAVESSELERLRYSWIMEDWPEERDGKQECLRLSAGLGLVMELAVAEPFLAPVDLSVYPNYALIVEYPMDLSTIKVSRYLYL